MDHRLGLDNAHADIEVCQVVRQRFRGGIIGALGAYGMAGLASNWARYGHLPWQYLLMTGIAVVLLLWPRDREARPPTSGMPRQ